MRLWLVWLLCGWAWAEPTLRVDLIPPEAHYSVRHSSGAALPGGPDPAASLPSGSEFMVRPLDGERGVTISVRQPGYEPFEHSYPLAQGKSKWNGSGWSVAIELRPVGAWSGFWHNLRFHPLPIYAGLIFVGVLMWLASRPRRLVRVDHYERDLVGARVDRYCIEGLLGEGSYAQVFLARHVEFGDVFALKMLRPYLAEGVGLQRIARELEIGRNLQHPRLVRILGFGSYRETPYLVMDYISGQTLSALLEQGRLDVKRALQLLEWICEGVEYAHCNGVIHRDLKPDNIMLTDAGGLKILDFGVARPSGNWATLTGTGQAIGTPAYMAPEQLLGNPGPASDVYALGVILYVMIRGQMPFCGEDVVAAHLSLPAPALESGLPWLDELCASMLEKSVSRRVASIGEVLQVLRASQASVTELSESTAMTSQQRNP